MSPIYNHGSSRNSIAHGDCFTGLICPQCSYKVDSSSIPKWNFIWKGWSDISEMGLSRAEKIWMWSLPPHERRGSVDDADARILHAEMRRICNGREMRESEENRVKECGIGIKVDRSFSKSFGIELNHIAQGTRAEREP